jgi:Mn-dependent DtxR family transcriptional regulator
MATGEPLDDVDERLLAYIKSYDFEKFPWNTEEAAAELGVTASNIYQSLSKLQKLRKRELFVYYKDGALHIQTE